MKGFEITFNVEHASMDAAHVPNIKESMAHLVKRAAATSMFTRGTCLKLDGVDHAFSSNTSGDTHTGFAFSMAGLVIDTGFDRCLDRHVHEVARSIHRLGHMEGLFAAGASPQQASVSVSHRVFNLADLQRLCSDLLSANPDITGSVEDVGLAAILAQSPANFVERKRSTVGHASHIRGLRSKFALHRPISASQA